MADFARDLADSAITLDALNVQFRRTLAADEGAWGLALSIILQRLERFGTLAISLWPYMVPFSITIDEAAAPHASLAFMSWREGPFVSPLMLACAAVNYGVSAARYARLQNIRHSHS